MGDSGRTLSLLAAVLLAAISGCYVPKSQLVAVETQARVLAEQNRAQTVEIENLKAHSRQTEDQLLKAERELSDQGRGGLAALGGNGEPRRGPGRQLPAAVSQQLSALSRQYPSLSFDPETGISKFDMDVLFDSGQAELKPAARTMLTELAQVLQMSDAKNLKVMVVGHTDDQRITGRATREKFANNFHLSTARALAVADQLRSQGLPDQRVGVAGFGAHDPVVSNRDPSDRQKNRRVEIFVMPPDVPVVGWSESGSGSSYF